MFRARRIAALFLPLVGCGDSLVSGPALDRLLGIEPFPARPAWLQMWVDEGGEGVLYSCDLAPVPGSVDEEDDDTVVLDQVWVPPPEWAEPVAWTEEESFVWALGLHVLVDRDRFDPVRAADAFDHEELEGLVGVWGMADTYARLHGEGDLHELGEAVVAGQVPPELDDDGRAWVGFAQEIVVATSTFAGAVTALDEEDQEVLVEDGLPVRRLDTLDQTSVSLLFGLPFGGVDLVGDCEDAFDDARSNPSFGAAP